MKNIFIFGDSNTFGWDADNNMRFNKNERYCGVLAKKLGSDFEVIAEGLGGRTATNLYDYSIQERYSNPLDYLFPCLQSHQPLDLFVVMLGTNDCKSCFNNTLEGIVSAMEDIIKMVLREDVYDDTPPQILLVSPIHITQDYKNNVSMMECFNKESVALSRGLAGGYKILADKYNCYFLDAADIAVPSTADGVHLDSKGHKNLAEGIYNKVLEIVNQGG